MAFSSPPVNAARRAQGSGRHCPALRSNQTGFARIDRLRIDLPRRPSRRTDRFAPNSLLRSKRRKQFPARANEFPTGSIRNLPRKILNLPMFSRLLVREKRPIPRNSLLFSLRPGNSAHQKTGNLSTASRQGTCCRERDTVEKDVALTAAS